MKNADFKPDLTPRETILLGAFGGGYFRNIYSSIAKKNLNGKQRIKPFKFFDGIKENLLHSQEYNANINYYKVKCGSSLEMWERSGWIKAPDYYGWFEWYCHYYNGRRSEDDERQIQRWKNFKQRFWASKNNLKTKQNYIHWCIKI